MRVTAGNSAYTRNSFLPERVASRPRYAYFPFVGVPRPCMGCAFVMIEAHVILATVAERYQLCQGTDVEVEPEPLITLLPRGGLPMLLVPRRDKRVS
jgi:cytochrome P450